MTETASSCGSCSDSSCAVKQSPPGQNPEQVQMEINLKKRLCHIRNKVLVMSGKGGVGKSSTAANLALALAMQHQAVGVLDVDIHGPSIPRIMGVEKERPGVGEDAFRPVNASGVKVMSLGFMMEKPDDAIIWRGAMKHGVIRQFIGDVDWGYLDYLVVDCPPGTGDEPLSVAQTVGKEGTQAIVVTTPQEVAIQDVRRSINFCRQLEIPILGIVENMSGFVCPGCGETHAIFKEGGGAALAAETGIPFLGAIPLDPRMTEAADRGTSLLTSEPESEVARAFAGIARKMVESGTGEEK